MASGRTRLLQALPLPYPIGLDFAGTVAATGADVSSVQPGDRVFGFTFTGGTAATHLLLDTAQPHALARLPPSLLSAVTAASLPCVGTTALLALRRADAALAGGVRGKRVFVPAALSGTGAMALQLAKRLYACETLSAVSGPKIPLIATHLGEGVVDHVIDYAKQDPVKAFGSGSVDFVFDTTGQAVAYMPLVRKGGLVLSIARVPPGSAMDSTTHTEAAAEAQDPHVVGPQLQQPGRTACVGRRAMNAQDAAVRLWARTRHGIAYEYMKTEPTSADLDDLARLVEEGKLRPVVGRTAKLSELETIRKACGDIFKGKGGLGKFVIEMDSEGETGKE